MRLNAMDAKINIKRRLITLFALLAAVLLLAVIAAVGTRTSALADGADIDYSTGDVTEISFDVNGKNAGQDQREENVSLLSEKSNFRTRVISVNVFKPNGIASGTLNGNGITYSTPDYFALEKLGGSGQVITDNNTQVYFLRFTALKTTAALSALPRVTLTYRDGGSSGTAVLAIKINAEFVPGQGENVNNAVFTFGNYDITLDNYAEKEFPLNTVFQNHTLKKQDGDTFTELKDCDESTPWTVNDASRFNVRQVIVEDGINARIMASNSGGVLNGRINSLRLEVNVTEADVKKFSDLYGEKDFWAKNALSVRLVISVGDSTTVFVDIPLTIKPANAPKSRTSFDFATSLNGGTNGGKGDSVFITAQSLCTFPTTSGITMNMIESDAVTFSNANVIKAEFSEGQDGAQSGWNITTAGMNGKTTATFTVRYDQGSTKAAKKVNVSFLVYGAYTLDASTFSLKGKKVTIDTSKGAFAQIYEDDYILSGVSLRYYNEGDNQSYIDYTISDSKRYIYITPQYQCNANVADVVLTFRSDTGREITVTAPLIVNINASDPFFGWPLWGLILFWCAIGIGVLLIVLLIIWLFMRGIHRRKLDELETSAPTSAYIIKLNSTIAAAQAQQRLATTQAFSAAQTQMLQLGAGPATTPAPGPTLALGGAPSQPYNGEMSMPNMGTFAIPSTPPAAEEIFIPLSDEELLRRIYEEKFAPRGMLERTFFKSKDLQARELEKEKERIREDVRGGMTIEEACRSQAQRAKAGETTAAAAPEESTDPIIVLLGFDPEAEIVAPPSDRDKIIADNDLKAVEDTPEVNTFVSAQTELDRVSFIGGEYAHRSEKCAAATAVTERDIQDSSSAIVTM